MIELNTFMGDNMIELSTFMGDGFGGYWICDDGKLISYRLKQPIQLKTYRDRKGYEYCKLWNNIDKTSKHVAIHRMVGIAFIPNPDNKPEINHKNRVKDDNRVDNLEWVTRTENVRHANNPVRNNIVCEIWYNGEFIDRFESKSKACEFASVKYGVGRSALMKYEKSKGCEIRRCNDYPGGE